MKPSTRAELITRRSYNRPLDDSETQFESWDQTVTRVMQHQQWLWERAQNRPLDSYQHRELAALRALIINREVALSGRTMWLGGTDIAKRREASQFNCAFLRQETVHDFVDTLWLLMQGCGVGGMPVVGTLSGFTHPMAVEFVRSARTAKGGRPDNHESIYKDTWTISIGDSAEAWAKALGKILAGKNNATRLVIDMSQIRPSGLRLAGYGWISSGDESLFLALQKITELLNARIDTLLSKIDLLDIFNWLGTVLSSRRSAEIALTQYGSPEWKEFALAKREHWHSNPQRAQSNNSLVFYTKPKRSELSDLFGIIAEGGGSEPGFINGSAALDRAPWFKGVNPCAEILLGNRSFCNLVEVDLGKFNGRASLLLEAVTLVARANYRQTCVNLDDGILQRSWHELNQFLRLCGVGVTGVVKWEHQASPSGWNHLRYTAQEGAKGMARELKMPMPKAVTTIKPSGTMSKVMDTTEGIHRPMGRYIFNSVIFSRHDPAVVELQNAGYRVTNHHSDPESVLVVFPVHHENIDFHNGGGGMFFNAESAVDQLNRYKMVMDNYVDHNCSITVSYSPYEVPEMINWIDQNWDSYVGVSFLYRQDPTLTAKDLGFPYLPQEVVTEKAYVEYSQSLKPLTLTRVSSTDDLLDVECVSGVCPIR